MECVLCKNGATTKGRVTVTLERGNTIVLVKNVPADICTNCGHYYLTEKITAELLKKGEEAVSKGAELEVVNLQVA